MKVDSTMSTFLEIEVAKKGGLSISRLIISTPSRYETVLRSTMVRKSAQE